ncbi:hypothetical protein QQ045_030312 [Rhodiola kirilowii]
MKMKINLNRYCALVKNTGRLGQGVFPVYWMEILGVRKSNLVCTSWPDGCNLLNKLLIGTGSSMLKDNVQLGNLRAVRQSFQPDYSTRTSTQMASFDWLLTSKAS